jgi:hypothetical protein
VTVVLGSSNMSFQDNDKDKEYAENTARDPRQLNDQGVCSNCSEEKGQDESVRCFLCKELFHALCFSISNSKEPKGVYKSDNPCTKSFLTGFVQNATNKAKGKRFGSFVFLCDNCRTRHETHEASTTNDQVQILDNRVTNLAGDVGEIKKLLLKITAKETSISLTQSLSADPDTLNQPDPVSMPSNPWNDRQRVKSLLVVAKDANVSSEDLEKTVVSHGVQVQKQYVDKKGDRVLIFPSKKSRDELKDRLTESGVSTNLMKEPKKRYPTISIVGLPKTYEIGDKDEICDILKKQNPYITQCLTSESSLFDIISVKPLRSNDNVKQAIVRLSDEIRCAIRNNDNRLYFGMLSCQVYDQLYIKRCNKCQGFGHYSKSCPNQSCCAICATVGHETFNCPQKSDTNLKSIYRCANCLKSNTVDSSNCNHPAYSQECHSYRIQQEKLRASLSCYSKN